MSTVVRGPGKTRELVRRWYLRGLSGTEIAAKVGVSKQAVSQHLRDLKLTGDIK